MGGFVRSFLSGSYSPLTPHPPSLLPPPSSPNTGTGKSFGCRLIVEQVGKGTGVGERESGGGSERPMLTLLSLSPPPPPKLKRGGRWVEAAAFTHVAAANLSRNLSSQNVVASTVHSLFGARPEVSYPPPPPPLRLPSYHLTTSPPPQTLMHLVAGLRTLADEQHMVLSQGLTPDSAERLYNLIKDSLGDVSRVKKADVIVIDEVHGTFAATLPLASILPHLTPPRSQALYDQRGPFHSF